MVKRNVHKLQKNIPNGVLFWEISIQGSTTKVRAGMKGERFKHYPVIQHSSPVEAVHISQHELKQKLKQGYVEISRPGRKPRLHEEQLHLPDGRRPNRKLRTSDHSSFEHEDVPDQDAPRDGDTDEFDTDSVASSVSSVAVPSGTTPGAVDGVSGVSPLNRRRTARWSRSQGELTMEAAAAPPPALLARVSTTYFLRSQLAATNLGSPSATGADDSVGEKWNWRRKKESSLARGETLKLASDSSAKSTRFGKSVILKKGKLRASLKLKGNLPTITEATEGRKRKTFTPLTPTPETSMKSAKKGQGKHTKRVLILTPEESTADRLKRQSTVLLSDEADLKNANVLGQAAKRICQEKLSRQTTLSVGQVYHPPEKSWPLELDAQIVWSVPLRDQGDRLLQGHAVHVDATRCLIAVEDGAIVELDDTVTTRKVYQLPSGVLCLVPDGDFQYAGCDDGALYDVTAGEPRLISQLKEFGQILSLDVHDGIVVLSDQRGNVAMVNHDGSVRWRQKSSGDFGWMVKFDNTGVYQGHSKGVTKYSAEDGCVQWHLNLKEGVLHGTKTGGALYVASGCAVTRVDLYGGRILQTYDKGQARTTAVHSTAAGGGLVFAGGKSIVGYHQDSGDVVYIFQHDFKPSSMQYFSGRLFCAGQGSLNVLDLTEPVITAACEGNPVKTVSVNPTPRAERVLPLRRLATMTPAESVTSPGVLLQCVRPQARQGSLKVKAISPVTNDHWDIQLPAALHIEGARYLVQELKPSVTGNFYRIFGDIKLVE